MEQVPNINYSSDNAIKYLRVRDLKRYNQNNEITISYKYLDGETRGKLKSVIDSRITYWLDKKSYLNPFVVEYLGKLFKLNQGTSITIDYTKLINDLEDDPVFEIIYKTHREKVTVAQDFRASIQKVLVERYRKLYNEPFERI